MSEKKGDRGLFVEVAPQGGILPNRSGAIKCLDVLLAQRSMHAYNEDAALVLRLEGGQRGIEKACELIDNKAHVTVILSGEQQMKLLKMLVGLQAGRDLAVAEQLVVPVTRLGF